MVSVGTIPRNTVELMIALKTIPTCAASVAILMWFWIGHWRWSRRFGLEDGVSTFLSLCLVFVMLIYVFPLRLVMSAGFSRWTNGYLPAEFEVTDFAEVTTLFIVFGLGFACFAAILVMLNLHARRLSGELHLDALERLRLGQEVATWGVVCVTSLISAGVAWVIPPPNGLMAIWFYASFGLTIPLSELLFERRIARFTRADPTASS